MASEQYGVWESDEKSQCRGYFYYNNSNKAILKLKHDLIQRTDERNYYKNKNEELNQQIDELKKQVAILEAHKDLLLLKIKEEGE